MLSRVTQNINNRPVNRQDFVNHIAPVMDKLKAVATETGAQIIDPVPSLCDVRTCPTVSLDGQPVYKDENHMRPSYAIDKAHYMDRILN